MKRWIILGYGIASYVTFLCVFLYSIAFTGNFFIVRSLDSEPVSTPAFAIMINLLLLLVFVVQHSLMARPFFKKWQSHLIPASAERSHYCMASNLAMILFFCFWQPIGPEVWHFENPAAKLVIYGLFFLGWAVLFASTCMINHFDLFGLRQVWLNFTGRPYKSPPFCTPGFYRYVRHPLYIGWLMIFWFTPVMSASHLLFSIGCTVYILVAIQWEEKDLVDSLGAEYQRYKNEVPMLVPRVGRDNRKSDSELSSI